MAIGWLPHKNRSKKISNDLKLEKKKLEILSFERFGKKWLDGVYVRFLKCICQCKYDKMKNQNKVVSQSSSH